MYVVCAFVCLQRKKCLKRAENYPSSQENSIILLLCHTKCNTLHVVHLSAVNFLSAKTPPTQGNIGLNMNGRLSKG